MNTPLVSIVTISYFSSSETLELIKSLQKSNYDNYEVIVVDNAQDPKCESLSQYEKVQLVKPHQNLGFAGGNNYGTQYAIGKYVMYLNNDMEVTSTYLSEMVNYYEQNPHIGALSPKIKYDYAKDTLQFAGYGEMNPYTVTCVAKGKNQIDNGAFDKAGPTPFIHGGAVMTKKSILENGHKMPEEYFLYYEELAWSTQLKNAGYQLHFLPSATVYHKESASIGKDSPLKVHYLNRNRVLYAQNFFKGAQKLIALLYLFLVAYPVNFVRYINSKKHTNALFSALKWNLKNLFTSNFKSNGIHSSFIAIA